MNSKRGSSKPICHACNRPFDPRSPGATLTMGPTCARYAGLRQGKGDSSQISLSFEPALKMAFTEGGADRSEMTSILSPRLQSSQGLKKNHSYAPSSASLKNLPKYLREKHTEAKFAFDELFREFHANGNLKYDNDALKQYAEILKDEIETHSLGDPLLVWLDPEHDVHLLIDRDTRKTYYWRVVNEVCTILEIDPRESAEARKHVATIKAFTRALAAFRQTEAQLQLSLDEPGF